MNKHFLLAAALLLHGGRDLVGQGPAMSLNAFAMRFSPEPVSDVEALPMVLRRPLALRLEHVTVGRALRVIAARAGLDLSYSRVVVPLERVVSVDVDGAPVAEALRQVLRDVPVELWVSTTGKMALVPVAAEAANGTVTGRVTDARTGQGVPGARVSLAGTSLGAVTNDSGGFRITGVPPGPYTLTARRIGFLQATQAISVVTDQELAVTVRLEVSASPLDAVVVTGTIAPTEQKALPNPISVITDSMIQERGITKVNDLFRGDIPGVFTADYGAASFFYGGPVYVRGTTELYDAPALKTYVDGVEVANSQYVNELDPTMIDHIEIIRGPEASTLYGAQAINGVMQVFTKKGSLGTPPHLTASAGITTQEGTYDTGVGQEDHLSVSGGATELSYNVGGTFQREGEWTPRHHVNTYSGYGSLSIRPARSPLHVDITARLGNQVGLGAGNEAVARAVMDGTLKFIGQGLPGRNDYSLPQEALGVTAQYARGGWQQTLTVGVDHGANGNNSGIVAPTYETPKDSLFSVFSSQTARFTAAYNSTWDVRLSDRLAGNLVVGADHWSLQSDTYVDYSTASDEGQLGNGGSIFLARQRDHSTGLFAQARLGLADALFFTAGARVDQGPALPADRHHRSTAPRVGVSYAAAWGNVSAKLRAGYGSALKPANPEERQFFEYFSDYWQLAAPNLKPERQTGWDAGLDLYAGTRSSLSITTYRQFAGDLITTVFGNIGAISTLQFVNVARVLNSGWELEGRVGVLPWLTAKATYTITTSKVDSLAPNDQTGYTVGQSLPGVPHHSGALTLIGRTRRFSGEASVSYVGTAINYDQPHLYQDYFIRLGPPSYAFDLVNTPAAMRFGLRLSYDLTSRLTLLARGENLTNKVVQDQGFIPIDQYGRTTFVGLRWR